MSLILAILFGLGGIGLIYFSAQLAPLMFEKTQLPFFEMAAEIGLGQTISKSLNTSLVKANRLGLVFAGIVLCFMAYALLFGPINI
jgi:hypothetical protein